MKKQTAYLMLSILLCSILFCSCKESNSEKYNQESEQIITTKNAKLIYSVDEYGNKKFPDTTCECSSIKYFVYMVNGCEYIKFYDGKIDDSQSSWGGHSGTCSNPIHQYKPEQIYSNPDSTNTPF